MGAKIIDRGRGPEIEGTRITVYDVMDWVLRSVLSASINAAFRLRPYESPYNSSC